MSKQRRRTKRFLRRCLYELSGDLGASSQYWFSDWPHAGDRRHLPVICRSIYPGYYSVHRCYRLPLITLPVEFDASRRALKLIDQLGILPGEGIRPPHYPLLAFHLFNKSTHGIEIDVAIGGVSQFPRNHAFGGYYGDVGAFRP